MNMRMLVSKIQDVSKNRAYDEIFSFNAAKGVPISIELIKCKNIYK